jgi:hypothetical protein
VVEVDAGDHRAICVDDVDGIQPPAHADLQHRHIELGAHHDIQNGQGGELEVGQRNRRIARSARLLDPCEGFHQQVQRDIVARQAQPLLEVHQVRRGVQPGAITRVAQDGLQHRAGRALAVGAGDSDDRALEAQAQPCGDGAHALQAHVDVLGVQALAVVEPVSQCFHARLLSRRHLAA